LPKPPRDSLDVGAVQVIADDQLYDTTVVYNSDGTFSINGVPASGALLNDQDGNLLLSWKIGHPEDEQRGRVLVVPHDGLNSSFNLFDHSTGKTSEFSTYEESFVLKARELDGVGQSSGGASATAPMTGTVDQVLVAPNQEVKAGQNLMIMIAMKMEHAITAPKDGTIEKVLYEVGQTAEKGSLLVKYVEAEE